MFLREIFGPRNRVNFDEARMLVTATLNKPSTRLRIIGEARGPEGEGVLSPSRRPGEVGGGGKANQLFNVILPEKC